MNKGRVLVATEGGVIRRQNSDGSDLRDFLDSNTPCPSMSHTETQRGVDHFSSRPTGIAIDPDEKKFFWTDWIGGTRVQSVDPEKYDGRAELRWSFGPSVNSAPLDGSSVIPVATSGEVLQSANLPPITWEPSVKLIWPHYLALDTKRKKIYWTDKLEYKIQRVNYDGSDPELDFHETTSCPGGIVVDATGGKIYYAEFHKIYMLPIKGGRATPLIASVGVVGGIDFDPAQNLLYWASQGTYMNPGGILRAKGFEEGVNRVEYCGIDYRGRRFMRSSGSCENVVYIPNGIHGIGRGSYQRGAVATPFDVKGDFEHGVLFWSGDEVPGIFDGLGGKVYRTSLCEPIPEQSWEKLASSTGNKPRGDFSTIAEISGDVMYPPYVRGVAIYPVSYDYEGSVPTAPCSASLTGTCHENYEWRDVDGNSCMDYALKKWCEKGKKGASFPDKAGAGGSAEDACCACGTPQGRTVLNAPKPPPTTPAPPDLSDACDLARDWSAGTDAEVTEGLKPFLACLKRKCLDQEDIEPSLFGSPCTMFGLGEDDPVCGIEIMYGVKVGDGCPRSCAWCDN